MSVSTFPVSSLDQACTSFLNHVGEVNPSVSHELIRHALRFSWNAHRDQRRKSGEPYLSHPLAVASILSELKLDSVTIAASLLHDVLEDTSVNHEMLATEFGEEIASLVDGVTKIQALEAKSREQRQAETYRKMLLSMARDIRVIIIKFADRLHNLRTLKYLDAEKIKAIASETFDIYAPLAHRLGMARIKWELEDLAFKFLHPESYKSIVSRVVATRHEREKLIDSFATPLRRSLESENIDATVVGRPKHFYSIYRKMNVTQRRFEEIYDLLAVRVITHSVRDCYHILGIVHSMWKPIQDRFKDYISTPKSNGYQSIHTTVVGERGSILEIQIRTWEMHQVAEDGIAAHWLYKGNPGEGFPSRDDRALTWLKNAIEWQKDLPDSAEFFEFFKIDLFHAEMFVFTPKGDLISLPKGATVLDFAFAVHTDLGLHCIGGKVDGKLEPINTPLQSGCTVEVLHSSSKKPSIDWLQHIKTAKARSAIRRRLRNANKREGMELGRKILRTHYNRLHTPTPLSNHVPGLLQHVGLNSLERLYEQLGRGELPINRVMQYFKLHKVRTSVPSQVASRIVETFSGRPAGVMVGDGDNVMVRFAQCCNPIPGDPIIGFVTRGRGIVIHRRDCNQVSLFSDSDERTIIVNWDTRPKGSYVVLLEVTAVDRPGLLHEITGVFHNYGVNVLEGTVRTSQQRAQNVFKVEIGNKNQLGQICGRINRIKGVQSVSRARDYIFVSPFDAS